MLPHDDRPSAVIIAKNSVSPMLYSSGCCFSSACDLLDEGPVPAVWGNEDGRNGKTTQGQAVYLLLRTHDNFVLRLQESFMQKTES